MDEAPTTERRGSPTRRGNLVKTVEEALRSVIESGEITVGAKLPSESALTQRYGVSRTVIREAVSALRLSGLVEARQGVGVFVSRKAPAVESPPATFRVEDPRRLSEVIELMELRAGIEVEAAGLAAARRSPAQAEAVRERWEDIELAIAAGRAGTEADLAFHLAIADATNNPQFRRMLEMMGRDAIPRGALGSEVDGSGTDEAGAPDASGASGGRATETRPRLTADYLRQIQVEHRAIADAIAVGDANAARAAMREHLEGSRDRYRALLMRD